MPAIAPYLLLMAAITLCFSTRLWRFMDGSAGTSAGRVNAIDGMRGYLALSVMVQHAVMMRNLLMTGRWEIPSSTFLPGPLFYAQLGSVAVSLFFMITGFLFWGKLVEKGGRPDWISLYIGRVFRLGPVYLIAVGYVMLIITAHTGLQLNEPLAKIFGEALRWASLGVFYIQHFNGYQNAQFIFIGVLWTLQFEWRFYGLLLPASLLATPRLHLPASLLLFVATFTAQATFDWNPLYLTLFSSGMLTASLRKSGFKIRLSQPVGSALLIIVLVCLFASCPRAYGALQGLLLAVVFFLACNGATLFGLLTSAASNRLGHASYGIYLLQGAVFWLGFRNSVVRLWVVGSLTQFWIVEILGALVLCIASASIYALIEYPAVQYGHRLSRRVTNALAKRDGYLPARIGE